VKITAVTSGKVKMMQKTVITKIDDLTGREFEKGETITFAFEGKTYEIDLNTFNARNFRRSMAKYMANARKVAESKKTDGRKVKHDPEYVHNVRAWAKENGYEVSDRGRVPNAIYEAYEKAAA
jgi:hypothetical protein